MVMFRWIKAKVEPKPKPAPVYETIVIREGVKEEPMLIAYGTSREECDAVRLEWLENIKTVKHDQGVIGFATLDGFTHIKVFTLDDIMRGVKIITRERYYDEPGPL